MLEQSSGVLHASPHLEFASIHPLPHLYPLVIAALSLFGGGDGDGFALVFVFVLVLVLVFVPPPPLLAVSGGASPTVHPVSAGSEPSGRILTSAQFQNPDTGIKNAGAMYTMPRHGMGIVSVSA